MTKPYWISVLSLLVGVGLSPNVLAQTEPAMMPTGETDSMELSQPSTSPMQAAPMSTQNEMPSGAIAQPMAPAGTLMTQPAGLEDATVTPTEPVAQPAEPLVEPNPRVAQVRRRARVGSPRNYIGVGGNIGFGGDTSLGQGSFTAFGKLGISPEISVRPSVFFADEDLTFLVPVTYNFRARSVAEAGVGRVYPYVGGGIGIVAADDDDSVGPVITGGLEIPISARLTGNAAVNVGFFDDADAGLTVGIGYNF